VAPASFALKSFQEIVALEDGHKALTYETHTLRLNIMGGIYHCVSVLKRLAFTTLTMNRQQGKEGQSLLP